MKRTLFSLGLIIISLSAYAQGVVYENKSISSDVLSESVKYAIYLPEGYDVSERTYSVLYLLHGLGDDHTGWIHKGNVQAIVDKSIKEDGTIPMIIVMPDAKRTWYVNDFKGDCRYEDMFFEELIPHIESTYRVKAEKHFRSIAGLSMGGHGALIYALHHPEMFGRCIAMSAAVYTQEDIDTGRNKALFASIYGNNYEKGIVTEHWNNNNAIYLMEVMPDSLKNAVKFYIDCGDDDFLYRGNSTLHMVMRNRKIPHEYRVRDGGHRWNYWQESLENSLKYISDITLHKRQ